jgi:hypothetical protein
MYSKPRSAYDQVGGMYYFARMLDKIRLHATDKLHPDYHANLGIKGDGWCVDFLRVSYDKLKLRVIQGGSDEEILQWCFDNGRKLNAGDIQIWNEAMSKKGWRDAIQPRLEELKHTSGLGNRTDILTTFDYYDADEGRKPHASKT